METVQWQAKTSLLRVMVVSSLRRIYRFSIQNFLEYLLSFQSSSLISVDTPRRSVNFKLLMSKRTVDVYQNSIGHFFRVIYYWCRYSLSVVFKCHLTIICLFLNLIIYVLNLEVSKVFCFVEHAYKYRLRQIESECIRFIAI